MLSDNDVIFDNQPNVFVFNQILKCVDGRFQFGDGQVRNNCARITIDEDRSDQQPYSNKDPQWETNHSNITSCMHLNSKIACKNT